MGDAIKSGAPPDQNRIQALLSGKTMPLRIETFGSVPSTNRLAQEAAQAGAREGLVFVAGAQTAGRGRKGRAFHSPEGTGLYMSLLLRPALPISEASLITPAAAVAVSDAIKRVADRDAGIKWVNDVLIGGKKVAGILTESSCDIADERLSYAVLGIGVNVLPPEGGFPKEIAGIAGTVFERADAPQGARELLAAAILDAFFWLYSNIGQRAWLNAYRARSSLLGQRVNVLSAQGSRAAVALSIDRDARLVVRYDDGETAALCSGEVSVRTQTHPL